MWKKHIQRVSFYLRLHFLEKKRQISETKWHLGRWMDASCREQVQFLMSSTTFLETFRLICSSVSTDKDLPPRLNVPNQLTGLQCKGWKCSWHECKWKWKRPLLSHALKHTALFSKHEYLTTWEAFWGAALSFWTFKLQSNTEALNMKESQFIFMKLIPQQPRHRRVLSDPNVWAQLLPLSWKHVLRQSVTMRRNPWESVTFHPSWHLN